MSAMCIEVLKKEIYSQSIPSYNMLKNFVCKEPITDFKYEHLLFGDRDIDIHDLIYAFGIKLDGKEYTITTRYTCDSKRYKTSVYIECDVILASLQYNIIEQSFDMLEMPHGLYEEAHPFTVSILPDYGIVNPCIFSGAMILSPDYDEDENN